MTSVLPTLSLTSLGALLSSCGPRAPEPATATEISPPETSSSTLLITSSGDPEAPTLLSVSLLDPSTLELTFTEPLEGVSDVAASNFRLSAGFHTVSPTSKGTQYFDPSRWNCFYDFKPCGIEEPCYDVCYPSEERPVDVLDVLSDVEDPSRIHLVLESPILHLTCWTILWKASMSDVMTGGLFLHYVNKGPPLTDGSGNAVASFGGSWAEAGVDYLLVEDQVFPELDPFLPIPCTTPD